MALLALEPWNSPLSQQDKSNLMDLSFSFLSATAASQLQLDDAEWWRCLTACLSVAMHASLRAARVLHESASKCRLLLLAGQLLQQVAEVLGKQGTACNRAQAALLLGCLQLPAVICGDLGRTAEGRAMLETAVVHLGGSSGILSTLHLVLSQVAAAAPTSSAAASQAPGEAMASSLVQHVWGSEAAYFEEVVEWWDFALHMVASYTQHSDTFASSEACLAAASAAELAMRLAPLLPSLPAVQGAAGAGAAGGPGAPVPARTAVARDDQAAELACPPRRLAYAATRLAHNLCASALSNSSNLVAANDAAMAALFHAAMTACKLDWAAAASSSSSTAATGSSPAGSAIFPPYEVASESIAPTVLSTCLAACRAYSRKAASGGGSDDSSSAASSEAHQRCDAM